MSRINAAPASAPFALRNRFRQMLDLDTIIGMVLALPLGILIGYMWRDRISQRRRERERGRRSGAQQ
jgi:H+/gluconate symporter-like permease